jgi:hypothetical protein
MIDSNDRHKALRPEHRPKVHLSDYELRTLSVPCTLCSAKPQHNCLDVYADTAERQQRETRPHVARLEAYERANGNPGAWGGTKS